MDSKKKIDFISACGIRGCACKFWRRSAPQGGGAWVIVGGKRSIDPAVAASAAGKCSLHRQNEYLLHATMLRSGRLFVQPGLSILLRIHAAKDPAEGAHCSVTFQTGFAQTGMGKIFNLIHFRYLRSLKKNLLPDNDVYSFLSG